MAVWLGFWARAVSIPQPGNPGRFAQVLVRHCPGAIWEEVVLGLKMLTIP